VEKQLFRLEKIDELKLRIKTFEIKCANCDHWFLFTAITI